MPDEVWARLVQLSERRRERAPRRRQLTAAERRDIEHRLEQWLAANIEAIEPLVDGPVELAGGPQWLLGADHGGTLDLLVCRRNRPGEFVVVELKAGIVRRDAIAQALGYVGWLRAQQDVKQVTALVIGLEEQQQVPWVRSMLGDEVSVRHWDEIVALPEHLRNLLIDA